MNVYDFDDTLFNPDSSFLFTVTQLRKHPWLFFRILPGVTVKGIGRLLGRTSPTELKEKIFAYLPYIDAEAEAEKFWSVHEKEIGKWYLSQKRTDDVIVSASPEFLLRPISRRLGFRLIATRMDSRTGRIDGLACRSEEKVRRFREQYGDAGIEGFYSDSSVDTPLALLAERAFRVDHGRLSPWKYK